MVVMSNQAGYLSNFLLDFKPSSTICIDHKDGNTLNNRKSNLQICTTQQNQLKKKMQKNNTSNYRGVTWYSKYNKWLAQIYFNYQRYYLGYFDTKEEAALAYNEKAKELFGEFAVLNKLFIKGGDYHHPVSLRKFSTVI